jgi:hypothetical protein
MLSANSKFNLPSITAMAPRVEPGDPRFLDHRREVDAGLTDHSPEQRGPIRAIAQGQRQEIEIARAVQPMR